MIHCTNVVNDVVVVDISIVFVIVSVIVDVVVVVVVIIGIVVEYVLQNLAKTGTNANLQKKRNMSLLSEKNANNSNYAVASHQFFYDL